VHHLVARARRNPVRLGAVLEAVDRLDLGAQRAPVEIQRLLGPAVEEQVMAFSFPSSSYLRARVRQKVWISSSVLK
jgi:hypothetical protein